MIHPLIIILSCLFIISHSKPADTCDRQEPCLDIKMKSLRDGEAYQVCIIFDSSRSGCNKDGTISHSCPTGNEYDKIDGWREGDKMCKTVKCGSKAEFGIKDGKGCRNTKTMSGLTNNGITDIRCEFNEGFCGGGNHEDCTWTVPIPQCPSEPECGGITGKKCEEGYYCVDDPNDNCDPDNGGRDCGGICVSPGDKCGSPPDDCAALRCACGTCPNGIDQYGCCGGCTYEFGLDGASLECSGIIPQDRVCPEVKPGFCGGIASIPCKDGYYCVDDPNDKCDPDNGGRDCGGICVQPGDSCGLCIRPLCACQLCPDGINTEGCCGKCEWQKGKTQLQCLYREMSTGCPVEETCPLKQPNPGDSCNWDGKCCYGEETCCGQTFDSFCCSCMNGQAGCYYTDACLGAPEKCQPDCSSQICLRPICPPDEELVVPEGKCCPVCQKKEIVGCPAKQPLDSTCNWEGKCCWGEESCCGETFDSFCCSCFGGQSACYYTDACLGAPEKCKPDCSAVLCPAPVCNSDEVVVTPPGECCAVCKKKDVGSCPVNQPSPGDSCNWEGSCCYGEETCCGETFDSFCCSCSNGKAACYNTDACLGAPDKCDPEPPLCVPDGATFIGDNDFCTRAKYICNEGYTHWNLANCGCGCRPECKVSDGGYFLDFKENCGYQTCKDGFYRIDDECGCSCKCESNQAKAELNINPINDHNTNYNNKWYDGLNDTQFLLLNAAISIITCLLIIALCLTCYYLFKKCNGPKYQIVEDQEVDSKI